MSDISGFSPRVSVIKLQNVVRKSLPAINTWLHVFQVTKVPSKLLFVRAGAVDIVLFVLFVVLTGTHFSALSTNGL
jgi:hypothetical protein